MSHIVKSIRSRMLIKCLFRPAIGNECPKIVGINWKRRRFSWFRSANKNEWKTYTHWSNRNGKAWNLPIVLLLSIHFAAGCDEFLRSSKFDIQILFNQQNRYSRTQLCSLLVVILVLFCCDHIHKENQICMLINTGTTSNL